ncbi:MAG: hypothetical protein JNL01_17025 [Bdellovibrionales bacterium]|nr:hypothetical protein [Bdellovibrionales bacterium]
MKERSKKPKATRPISLILTLLGLGVAGWYGNRFTHQEMNRSPAQTSALGVQDHHEVIQKYWNYRQKLFERFIHLKGGPGDGMVASQRDGGEAVFSDATVVLGWYLATLGTELDLLKRLGKPTASNLLEISHVLDAQDRLTALGNQMDGIPGSDTGYFFRDDVDRSIIGKLPGTTTVRSDFLSSSEDPANWGFLNQMSQDQAINMLLGYRMLAMSLDEKDSHAGKNLRTQMEKQVERIVRHLRGKGDWQIRFPGTRGRGSKTRRGPDARAFSEALADIGQAILGKEAWKSKMKEIKPAWFSVPAFELMRVRGVPYPFWTQAMILILGSTGDVWGKSARKTLGNFARRTGLILYPLLHAYVHDSKLKLKGGFLGMKDNGISQTDFMELMKSAPAQGPNGSDKTQWCGPQRFYKSRHYWTCPVQYKEGDYWHFENEEFPGFDYMFFHNLYLLHYNPEGIQSYGPTPGYEAALKAAQ